MAVSVTIARANIPFLADSFAYFLSKNVRQVGVQPAMGQDEWSEADLRELDRQLRRVVDRSAEHYADTGQVAFAPFGRTGADRRQRGRRTWGCSAPTGSTLAIDVDGQVFPCALAARSYQRFQPGIDERARLLSLGDVRDPRFGQKLAALAEGCHASGLFAPKGAQHSGDRPCATCRERGHCVVCPFARVRRANLVDVNDIPPYLCAYERTLAKNRRRFLADVQPLRGQAVAMHVLREARARNGYAI